MAESPPVRNVPAPARSPRWDFFWLLVKRDLKVRYAGSTLGALWNLIHPIVMILVYTVIFSSLFNRGDDGGPRVYIIHLCSGILVWLVFAEVLNRSVATLVENANFLQKLAFPPLILHGSVLFNVLLVYGVGLIALWLILLLTGGTGDAPVWKWLAVFPVMALVGVAASGLGMILSALNIFFRDTAQIIIVILQIGFWFNPIVYPKSLLENSPLGAMTWLLFLNPVEHFVSTAQDLLGDPSAEPWSYAPAVVILFPAVCLILGVIGFGRLLPEVRDNL